VDRREDILHALAASSARVVTLCGGEPLLVRRVDQFGLELSRRGKATVLNTNGELLRRRLDQGFRVDVFSMVGLSIEGSTPEVHRAMRGAKADLDEVIAAAQSVAGQADVGLKLATVVSAVNADDLPYLAKIVGDLRPQVWRLYEYSARGDQNFGQRRHRLPAGQFALLVAEAAKRSAPVPAAPSTEDETEGCLIVDPAGNVLQPVGAKYVHRGNCLEESLDDIWARMPQRSTIVGNKKWLSVLA
jgi:MoaA/NifB/PqqE/SkfB family radical SAM enzyme